MRHALKLISEACIPKILQLSSAYSSPPALLCCPVQELCTGGTLKAYLRARGEELIPEAHAAAMFGCIIKSVLHCHQVRWKEGGLRAACPLAWAEGGGGVGWRGLPFSVTDAPCAGRFAPTRVG